MSTILDALNYVGAGSPAANGARLAEDVHADEVVAGDLAREPDGPAGVGVELADVHDHLVRRRRRRRDRLGSGPQPARGKLRRATRSPGR